MRWIHNTILIIFCTTGFLTSCKTFFSQPKLVLSEENLAGFLIHPMELEENFSEVRDIIHPTSCQNISNDNIRDSLLAILIKNPSVFRDKPKPLFPSGKPLEDITNSIYNNLLLNIEETNISMDKNTESNSLNFFTKKSENSNIYFYIYKEEDDLQPFTRILRTNFYLFCEDKKLNLIFDEIRENIIFQNQYTWSEWINVSRFRIVPGSKERLSINDRYPILASIKSKNSGEINVIYSDWIVFDFAQNGKLIDKKNSNLQEQRIEGKAKSIEERLNLLKDLKKKGLITNEEYNQKRKEILDSI